MAEQVSKQISGKDSALIIYALVHLFFDVLFAIWIATNGTSLQGMTYQEAIAPFLTASIALDLIGFFCIKRAPFIDLGLWFVLSSFAFMFGNVFLEVFDLETSLTWDPSIYYSEIEKYTASLYALFCINAISLGCILVPSGDYEETRFEPNRGRQLRRTGFVCLIVGFTASVIQSSQLISVTQAAGTYETYSTASTSVLIDDLSYLFVVGVVSIVASGAIQRRASFCLTLASCAYYIAVMTLSGSRKFAIFAIIALSLNYLWIYRNDGLSVKKIVLTLLGAVLVLNLLYVIREYRTDLLTIIPNYLESLATFNFLNLLGEVFAETGLTFYSVVGIIATVPSVFPYELGATLFRSLFSFLPIGWLMGDFFTSAASTQVINTYTGLPVGASLIGDFYWNWGFVGGVIASLCFGAILSAVSTRLATKASSVPIYFSVLFIVLVGVRAGIFEIYRPLVMVIVLPILISMIVNRKSTKIRGHND